MDPAETSDTASAHPAQDYEPLALIDGSCALCGWAARWIDRLDRSGRVRIMPIQSATGQAVLRHFGEDPEDPETWLFVENGRAASGLEAVAALGRACGGVGRILQTVMILPAPLRRGLYRLVARNRYRMFGRRDICEMAPASLRARLVLE
ncbi:MAG: DCC1-like thiol-disulfide oxidoreductase family protein [Pseudomonadota bacterium]